jgi:hypothetical protein
MGKRGQARCGLRVGAKDLNLVHGPRSFVWVHYCSQGLERRSALESRLRLGRYRSVPARATRRLRIAAQRHLRHIYRSAQVVTRRPPTMGRRFRVGSLAMVQEEPQPNISITYVPFSSLHTLTALLHDQVEHFATQYYQLASVLASPSPCS